MTGLLVVTAVPAEAEAIRAGLAASTAPAPPDGTVPSDGTEPPDVTVLPVGVGPAVAGAATARVAGPE